MSENYISEHSWDNLSSSEKLEYVRLLERESNEFDEILDMVPCPQHGRCVSHLRQWIKEWLEIDHAEDFTQTEASFLGEVEINVWNEDAMRGNVLKSILRSDLE